MAFEFNIMVRKTGGGIIGGPTFSGAWVWDYRASSSARMPAKVSDRTASCGSKVGGIRDSAIGPRRGCSVVRRVAARQFAIITE
jgi:hypothetical protein